MTKASSADEDFILAMKAPIEEYVGLREKDLDSRNDCARAAELNDKQNI